MLSGQRQSQDSAHLLLGIYMKCQEEAESRAGEMGGSEEC